MADARFARDEEGLPYRLHLLHWVGVRVCRTRRPSDVVEYVCAKGVWYCPCVLFSHPRLFFQRLGTRTTNITHVPDIIQHV